MPHLAGESRSTANLQLVKHQPSFPDSLHLMNAFAEDSVHTAQPILASAVDSDDTSVNIAQVAILQGVGLQPSFPHGSHSMDAIAEDSVGSKEPKIPSALYSGSKDAPDTSAVKATQAKAASAFTGDFSGVSWNCRSLWSHMETATIQYVEYLLTVHDFVVLQETRETAERLAFLKKDSDKRADHIRIGCISIFRRYCSHRQR